MSWKGKLVINLPRAYKSYIVKENCLGSAVGEILQGRLTDRHAHIDILLLLYMLAATPLEAPSGI